MTQDNTLENNGGMSFGEIATIRNILVGPQIAELEQNLAHLGDDLSQTRQHFQEQIKALEDKVDNRLNLLEQNIQERFDHLEKLLQSKVEELHNRVATTSRSDKEKIGKMLAELGNQLFERD